MKLVRIKETGSEILAKEVDGGYKSVFTDKTYSVDEVEVVGEQVCDTSIQADIDETKAGIKRREDIIRIAERGIEWLEKYKNDYDAPNITVRLSFLDHDFNIDKRECAAFLQKVKYDQEQMLYCEQTHLANMEDLKNIDNGKTRMFTIGG